MIKASYCSKYEHELLIFLFLMIKIMFLPQVFGVFLPLLSALALSVFLSLILGSVIRASDEKSKRTVLVFVAFFLGSCVSNAALFLNGFEKTRIVYVNTLIVFCLLASFASAGKKDRMWEIPVLCVVCTAASPVFVFTYLPVIALLMVYQLHTTHFAADKWLFAVSMVAVTVALLIFRGSLTFIDNYGISEIIKINLGNILYSLIIVLPLIAIFGLIWINTIRASKDKGFKWIVFMIMLSPVTSFFALAFSKNVMDPIMTSMFSQCCFAAYLFYNKDKAFLSAFKKNALFFDKNLFLAISILIYLSAFSFYSYNNTMVNLLGH